VSGNSSQHHQIIGIFGGTFDPVHFGHLRAAVEAREKLGLKEFRMIPAGTPPLRSNTFATASQRMAMLKLALSDHQGLSVDDREIKRHGNSFMVDTLAEIHNEMPHARLLLMIGQDAANSLDQWYQWRRLFELSHLVILRRPESEYVYSGDLLEQMRLRKVSEPGELFTAPAGKVLSLEVTQLAISSTDIRRRIGLGLSLAYLLPEAVIDYIRVHGLYAS
jgi:nicotinate-nucleotide adenylyltransferase